jgi:hypothetical protein
MGPSNWPKIGAIPSKHSEHASQLVVDTEAILEAWQGGNKSVPYKPMETFLRSVKIFAEDSQKLASADDIQELHTSMKALSTAVNETKKELKEELKVINSNTSSNQASTTQPPGLRTLYSKIAEATQTHQGTQGGTTKTQLAGHTERQITIKPNDPAVIQNLRNHSASQLRTYVETAIKRSVIPQVAAIKIVAARQLASGDVAVYTATKIDQTKLLAFEDEWIKEIGPKATTPKQSYAIILHGVHTNTMDLSDPDSTTAEVLLAQNKHTIPDAQIRHMKWLTRSATDKKTSSAVIEFTRKEDANTALRQGLVWDFNQLQCEYYERKCQMKQCFNCQRYGHTGPQCYAPTACAACAGPHSTRDCPDKEDPTRRKCVICKGPHGTWNNSCPARKRETERTRWERSLRPCFYPEEREVGRGTTKENPVQVDEDGFTRVQSRQRKPPVSTTMNKRRRAVSPETVGIPKIRRVLSQVDGNRAGTLNQSKEREGARTRALGNDARSINPDTVNE